MSAIIEFSSFLATRQASTIGWDGNTVQYVDRLPYDHGIHQITSISDNITNGISQLDMLVSDTEVHDCFVYGSHGSSYYFYIIFTGSCLFIHINETGLFTSYAGSWPFRLMTLRFDNKTGSVVHSTAKYIARCPAMALNDTKCDLWVAVDN